MSWPKIIFLKLFILCIQEESLQRKMQKEHEVFQLLVHSPNVHNGQSLARQMTEGGSSLCVSQLCEETWIFGPFSAAFPDTFKGAGLKVELWGLYLYSIWNTGIRGHDNIPCHNEILVKGTLINRDSNTKSGVLSKQHLLDYDSCVCLINSKNSWVY